MSVKLSACIVVYDNYEEVKAEIVSMKQFISSELNKRIYIVDNGTKVSNPDKIAEFKKFLEMYHDIEYIDAGENLGYANGNNVVLDIIDSDYHVVMNPDILFCEDVFTKVVEWMETNKDVGMVIPKITDEEQIRQDAYRNELTIFDLFNRVVLNNALRKRANLHTMQYEDFSKPFQVPFGHGSFLIIRTELFKKLKGFDDHYFMYVEDADLCKRVNRISKLMYYPYARVIHKWKKESHKNITLFSYHMSSMVYYFKKWGWKIR